MDDKNTKKLFGRFKTFLKKKTLDGGFECGDGWYTTLFGMFTCIEATYPPDNFRITKIFEKFGELKIHSVGGTCATRCAIEEAIEAASDICQHCGHTKELQKCDKCKQNDPGIGDYVPDIKSAVILPNNNIDDVANDHA